MSTDSKDMCPVLPGSANRQVCTSAVVGLGVGIGAYYKLRNSDLKVLGVDKWDLQDNRYFVPGVSFTLALMGASTAGLISYLMSNKN